MPIVYQILHSFILVLVEIRLASVLEQSCTRAP